MSELSTEISIIEAKYAEQARRATVAEAAVATLTAERDTLKAALAACEAAQPTPVPPPPEPVPVPPTTPTWTAPKILNERFTNGVDWTRYFADSGGGPAAPEARFAKTADGLKIIYIANNPTGTKRTELGIRATVGGGATPRRDPVGSERWYLLEFIFPSDYDMALPDEKRVIWQAHQGNSSGIVNPPLSLELRNGTFRLVRSVLNDAREEFLDPDDDPDGIPMVKGQWNRMLLHILWHATSGFIEGSFNSKTISKLTRKMCNPVADGLNIKTGVYFPGFTSFAAGYRHEHMIRRWAIGDASNKVGDFA